jgi:twitching motility protein PilT
MTSDQSPRPAFDLVGALTRMVETGASDMHLKAGNRPLVRLDGKLVALDPDTEPLRPRDTEGVLQTLLSPHLLAEFERRHELDFAHGVRGLGRFRVNAYRQRGTIALVLRAVSGAVPTLEELGLPDVVRVLTENERGLVLVTGTPGSGRSTTVAAMLEHINTTMSKHVVTIEDPIEFLFKDNRSSIDQREVGVDTESFMTALRQVMRQDPDVIFIAELRDAETAAMALAAAASGHLVISTLLAPEVPDAVNRLMELFAADEHVAIRATLADQLRGIIAQQLVPTVEAGKHVAVTEVMTMTSRTRDALLSPRGTSELGSLLRDDETHGMHTFTQSLHHATTTGQISMSVAMTHTSHPHDLRLLVGAAEQRASAPALAPAPTAPVAAEPAEPPADAYAPRPNGEPVRFSTPPPGR